MLETLLGYLTKTQPWSGGRLPRAHFTRDTPPSLNQLERHISASRNYLQLFHHFISYPDKSRTHSCTPTSNFLVLSTQHSRVVDPCPSPPSHLFPKQHVYQCARRQGVSRLASPQRKAMCEASSQDTPACTCSKRTAH